MLTIGIEALSIAAEISKYTYPEGEDPQGAFAWFLNPCGDTSLVPDNIKKVFGILSNLPPGISSFTAPKNIKKGSGKKGDRGNPHEKDRDPPGTPRRDPKKDNDDNCKRKRAPGGASSCSSSSVTPTCRIQGTSSTRLGRAGRNTYREDHCSGSVTVRTEWIITSITYQAGAPSSAVETQCAAKHSHACYHYSSVLDNHPNWRTLPCPTEAASTEHRLDGDATSVYLAQHTGNGWIPKGCDKDEYPPAYLLDSANPIYINGGHNDNGQMVRLLPAGHNRGAGNMWGGACFGKPLSKHVVRDIDIKNMVIANGHHQNAAEQSIRGRKSTSATTTWGRGSVTVSPYFTITAWGMPADPTSYGLDKNPCWPKAQATADPGFALLTYDPWYVSAVPTRSPQWDYRQPYNPPSNGD